MHSKVSSARIFALVLVTAASLQLCDTARAQLPGDPPAAAIRKSTALPTARPHRSAPALDSGILLLQRTGVLHQDIEALNAKLRRHHPHRTPDQLADMLIQQASLRSGVAGAVAALPGIIPYAGVPLRIAAMAPEYLYLFREQAILTLRLAELYGQLPKGPERGQKILVMLAAATGLPESESTDSAFKKFVGLRAVSYATTRGASSVIARSSLMGGAMASIGMRTVAKAVPFLGIFTSSGLDYVTTRVIGGRVKKLYRQRSGLEAWAPGAAAPASSSRSTGPARRHGRLRSRSVPARGMTRLLGATGS